MHNPVIIDSQSGEKVINAQAPFILALKQGESLFDSILHLAHDAKLLSASISGLGGLSMVEVAYYDINEKKYQTKLFSPMHELISMNGNIAFLDGKHFIHIHAAIGDEEYKVFGGHIMSATVNPSAEITIIPLNGKIERKYDAATGLKLMCPIV